MSKYKVRLNLDKGEHSIEWKVTSPKGNVDYYDPNKHTLVMRVCKLRNQPSCAWIEAERVEVRKEVVAILDKSNLEVSFNPRKQPHWVYCRKPQNIDNKEVGCIVTTGRRLWDVAPSQCYTE